jgi:two-component system LytT family response regulator
MKLRVLIADDEPLSRDRLRQFLLQEPDVRIVAECADGLEVVRCIQDEAPDAAFLDVRMPGLDGFGVMEALAGGRMPAIVLVTAHEKFAVQAFAANVVDYLLKPFDRERFQTSLARVRGRLQQGLRSGSAARAAARSSRPDRAVQKDSAGSLHRLTIRSHDRISLLPTSEVDWVQAADNYVELHAGDTTHLLRMTLAALAERLGDAFLRISRSCLINAGRIREVRSKAHGDFLVVLHDGTTLAGSRNFRSALRALLGKAS